MSTHSRKAMLISLAVIVFISIVYGSDSILTLRLVHPDHDKLAYIPPEQVNVDKSKYELFEKNGENYWISKKIELDIADMTDAQITVLTPPSKEDVERLSKEYPNTSFPLNPSYNVTITLNPKGREKFSIVTANNIRRRLAIIYNGKLLMAPIIMDRIDSGLMEVSTFSSYAEAKSLSDAIRSKSGK